MEDGRKAVWSIPYVSVASFFPSLKQNFIAYRSSKVQIAFLKFTSCDNQVLVGCIPIAAVAVHLKLKSKELVSHLIRGIAITYWIFKSLRQFLKSLETYRIHLV